MKDIVKQSFRSISLIMKEIRLTIQSGTYFTTSEMKFLVTKQNLLY